MQEEEETGVAESWQEIIFRVHQPPPAQSAEKKLERRAQASRHMFTYLRLEVKLSRSSFDSRWYKHRVLQYSMRRHTIIPYACTVYFQRDHQTFLDTPSLLTCSTSTARKRKHASIARKHKHSIQGRVQHCPQVADSRQAVPECQCLAAYCVRRLANVSEAQQRAGCG